MSIANRIEQIEQHLADDYSVLTLAGADLTNVDKNIVNLKETWQERLLYFINNGTNIVWNNWEKVNATGENATMNQTLEAPMKIDLKGNTYQYSTTGKNLANIYNIADFSGNAFKRKIENDTITIWDNTNTSGYSTSEKKLSQICPNLQVGDSAKLTFTTTYQTKYIYLSGKNITWYSGATKTIDQDMLDSIVAFYGGYQTTTVISEFMIRLSSITDNTYEPYTNGASPNPDYPQDIQVVSGDNEIKIEGKNPLNPKGVIKGRLDNGIIGYGSNTTSLTATDTSFSFTTNANYRGVVSNVIEVKSGTYGMLSYTSDVSINIAAVAYYDKNMNFIQNKPIATQTYGVRWQNNVENAKYIRISFILNSSGSATITNPQVEFGTEPTSYEPYVSQSYPIYLGVENLIPTQTNAWEQGTIAQATGQDNPSTTRIRTIDYYPIKNDTDYYYSLDSTDYVFVNLMFYNSSKTYIGNYLTIDNTFAGKRLSKVNIPSSSFQNVAYFRATIRKSDDSTIVASDIETIKPQIELGSKVNHFTPYGTTPIELCKIGNYQDSIKKSTGKNLFDKDNATYDYTHYKDDNGVITQSSSGSGYCETYIKVEPNTQYTFSYNGWDITRIYYFDNNKDWISRTSSIPVNLYTFTTPDNCYYIQFQISSNFTGAKIQLEKGSQATTYEPYGIEWYIEKKIGKIVLDGSESWTKYGTYGNGYLFYLDNVIFGLISSTYPFGNGLSDKFIWTQDSTPSAIAPYIRFNGLGNRLYMAMTSDMALEEFKTWLSNNNTIVYYALETPTSEEITDTTLINQLNNLENANSYDEQTNVSQANNDYPFIISATALEMI